MSRSPRRLPLAVTSVAAVAVLLSACGSSGGGDASGADGASGGGDSSAEESDGSPLDNLFGFDESSQRAVEDAIASCMRDRGWEYTPRPPVEPQTLGAEYGSEDFVAEYGYGISTQPPMGGVVGTTAGGGDNDPNAAYQKTLSEADKERYFTDLFGQIESGSGGGGGASGEAAVVEMGELDPNACMTIAQEQAAEDNPALSEEFNKRLSELFSRLQDDPRAIEAQQQWSACMADAGFVYDAQEDVFSDLVQRYTEIAGPGPQPDANGAIVVGGPGSAPQLSPPDAERLSKLQDEERAVAKADAECAEQHLAEVTETIELEIYETLQSEFPGLGAES